MTRRRRHSRDSREQVEIVVRAQTLVQSGVLEQRANAFTDRAGIPPNVKAEYFGGSGGGIDETEESANHRRFSGAVGSQETKYAPVRNVERYVLERIERAEPAAQTNRSNGGIRHPYLF
jgi:hypothetical protein